MNDYHWDISCDALTGDIVMELYRNGLMTDWSVRERGTAWNCILYDEGLKRTFNHDFKNPMMSAINYCIIQEKEGFGESDSIF